MFPKWYEAATSTELEAINNISDEEVEIFNTVLEKMMMNLK